MRCCFIFLHETKPHHEFIFKNVNKSISHKDKVKLKTNQYLRVKLNWCKDPRNQQVFDPKSVQMGFNILPRPHYSMYLQKFKLDLSGICTE